VAERRLFVSAPSFISNVRHVAADFCALRDAGTNPPANGPRVKKLRRSSSAALPMAPYRPAKPPKHPARKLNTAPNGKAPSKRAGHSEKRHRAAHGLPGNAARLRPTSAARSARLP
jgi:hypothetical protein